MLAIYGPGGFGRELVPIATQADRDAGFVSDNTREIGSTICGLTVHSLEQLCSFYEAGDIEAVIAVSDAKIRRGLAEKLAAVGINDGRAVAANAIIGPDVKLGVGAILCHFDTVTASASIGRHIHANIYSYIAHDTVIGDFVTLAPRVCINGNTVVEDDVYIGTGAVLKQGTTDNPLRIGKGAIIGMGAVVTKDVAPGTVVVGNPARPLERNH